jgi:hypothetical protein
MAYVNHLSYLQYELDKAGIESRDFFKTEFLENVADFDAKLPSIADHRLVIHYLRSKVPRCATLQEISVKHKSWTPSFISKS